MPDPAQHLLLLDADRAFTRAATVALRQTGWTVTVADDTTHALRALADRPAQILIVDPDTVGSRAATDAWLRDLHRQHPALVPILLTAHPTVPAAVEALRGGAFDYLSKPITLDRLRDAVDRALRYQRLLDESTPTQVDTDDWSGMAGPSGDPKMCELLDLAAAVADARSTVLIVGETGTGKSRLARAIHQRSPRRDRPFVEVACGSLSDALLASELFGHVKGAFTGAVADRPGRFAAADGGTIFLDEINSAPLSMQVQLLRVLQERAFEPVGSTQTRSIDVRAIVATNADLPTLVAAGAFREDLFHRINVVTLAVPPLRDRPGDIQPLAERFLERFRREAGRQTLGFTDEAAEALGAYRWPGNVRELENAIERAVLLCRRPMIDVADLPPSVRRGESSALAPTRPLSLAASLALPAMTLEAALLGPERAIIESALERNGWCRKSTAQELGIDRTTLYKKMRRHGLGGERARDAA